MLFVFTVLYTLHKKWLYSVFSGPCFPTFSHIRICPYSVRMQESTDQKNYGYRLFWRSDIASTLFFVSKLHWFTQ